MLGVSLILIDDYEVISNREAGKGRCDIILKAKHHQTSFVLEFKYLKSDKEEVGKELEQPCDEGFKRIITKQYDAGDYQAKQFILSLPIIKKKF